MWTTLEVAKLLVGIATPLTVIAVGWWIKQREQINAELVKKRIALYDEVGPKANDILCFFRGVGHWRELDPQKVIEAKRAMDRCMYRYRPFWSEACWQAYDGFIKACFQHFGGGAGKPALLRLDTAHLTRMVGAEQVAAWRPHVSDTPSTVEEVQRRYDAWMAELARAIGVPGQAGR